MSVKSLAQDTDRLPQRHAESSRLYAGSKLISAAYLVVAVLVGSADILYILRHYTRIPFGDYWIWLAGYYRNGLLWAIYAQVNEHRISVPGIFYFLDHRYLGGTNTFLVVVSIVIQIGCIALLTAPLWRRSEIAAPVRWIFTGFVVITMFWFIQAEDFFYPFSFCLSCANLGILAALHLFADVRDWRAARTGRAIGLWTGLLGSAVWATFSYGHGMLVWPVMLAISLALRYPKRSMWIIALAFICVLGIYFADYQAPLIHPGPNSGAMTTNPLDALLHRPLKVALYVILMLGLPFFGVGLQDVSFPTHVGAYALTSTGMLVAAAYVWTLWRRQEKSRSEIMYCSVLLLCAGAACITALGRSNFPVWQALSGRYSPVPLLFWISLAAVITIELWRREARGGLGRAGWCLVLILASLSTLSTQVPIGRYMANRERLQEAAAASIAIGVPDEANIRTEFTLPQRVREVDRAAARNLGHSLFARPETPLLGTPLLGRFHLAPAGACTGVFDKAVLLPDLSTPGARLIGWAWDSNNRRDAERIWVTDEQMTIRGFGVTHVDRLDVAAAKSDDAMQQAGWIAYARLASSSPGALRVFADLGHDTVCPIAPPRNPVP